MRLMDAWKEKAEITHQGEARTAGDTQLPPPMIRGAECQVKPGGWGGGAAAEAREGDGEARKMNPACPFL